MLEQYRKDFPNENNDLLPDSQSSSSRKRLILILTGSTCALFLLLVIMGVFKSEDDYDVASSGSDSSISSESSIAYEKQIQELQARIDKLESELNAKNQIASVVLPSQEKPFFEEQSTVSSNTVLNSPEEAVAMTDQALRNYIVHEEKQSSVAAVEAPAPKKVKPQTTVAATSKPTTPSKNSSSSNFYVVQKGDTLSKISQRFFGTPNRWKSVYEANKERISNINKLKVGTKLVIPQ